MVVVYILRCVFCKSASDKHVTSSVGKENSHLDICETLQPLTQKENFVLNGFLKILSISSSHTNGHPAVVPMVTALNHVVADGRRAGGLNLSSSILTDYRETERVSRRRCLGPRRYRFLRENSAHLKWKSIILGVLNSYYAVTPSFFEDETEGKMHSVQYCTWVWHWIYITVNNSTAKNSLIPKQAGPKWATF